MLHVLITAKKMSVSSLVIRTKFNLLCSKSCYR